MAATAEAMIRDVTGRELGHWPVSCPKVQSRLPTIIMSPHMLRPFSSRQLGLVEGDGCVVVFGVLGGRYAGPSAMVHAPTLMRRMSDLPRSIATVVYIDKPVPDASTVSTIDDMIAAFDRLDADVLVQYVAATEAVKRVDDEKVVEGIDRTSLLAIRCPEVTDREALDRAVSRITDELWVSPTALIAAMGGKVALYRSSTVHQ